MGCSSSARKALPSGAAPSGRKWRKAREVVELPEGFRFYHLRHTGHTLSTRSGATLKDTMVRAGQSSEKAALIYQHSDDERQQEVAAGLDATVRKARQEAQGQAQKQVHEAAAVPEESLADLGDQVARRNSAASVVMSVDQSSSSTDASRSARRSTATKLAVPIERDLRQFGK